jgi:hypothetical protein
VKLTISLQVGTKYFGCVLCRFHIAASAELRPDKCHKTNCLEPSASQLASTFGSGFFLLLVRLNLGFILRETCLCAHHTFLLGFPTRCLASPIKHFSGAVAGEKEYFCKGSLLLPIFYFFIVLLIFFTLFLLASFYQKYKKISSYFKLLLCLV